jgi:hypothetical protein
LPAGRRDLGVTGAPAADCRKFAPFREMSNTNEVRRLLPRYFAASFHEIKDLAPGLGRVTLIAPRTGDKKLH